MLSKIVFLIELARFDYLNALQLSSASQGGRQMLVPNIQTITSQPAIPIFVASTRQALKLDRKSVV